MDYSLPGSSVHGISQARILEWVAISFSRASSWPRDRTLVSCTSRWFLYHWATWEAFHWGFCMVKLVHWCLPLLPSFYSCRNEMRYNSSTDFLLGQISLKSQLFTLDFFLLYYYLIYCWLPICLDLSSPNCLHSSLKLRFRAAFKRFHSLLSLFLFYFESCYHLISISARLYQGIAISEPSSIASPLEMLHHLRWDIPFSRLPVSKLQLSGSILTSIFPRPLTQS